MAGGGFGGGDGTELNPYLVEDAADLSAVRNDISAHYKQTADIDLAGIDWESIGDYSTEDFTGTFDGDNHLIKNLTVIEPGRRTNSLFSSGLGASFKNIVFSGVSINNISGSNKEAAGLVIYFKNGTIHNCHVLSGQISRLGTDNVAGLVAYSDNSSISRCSVSCTISSTGNAAGIAAYNNYGNITECFSTVTVNGWTAGGLVGYNSGGNISKCYAAGEIGPNGPYGASSTMGGLIGYNYEGQITDCFATCTIQGTSEWDYGGGLVGYNDTSSVENCYSTGAIIGCDNYHGGLIGEPRNSTVTSCYYDSGTSGQSDDDGRGVPKTTAQMKNQETFVGWDFVDTWVMSPAINNGYPALRAFVDVPSTQPLDCEPPIIESPYQATSAKCPLIFRCPNPAGESNWMMHFKVQVYADEAGSIRISEISSLDNPELFKVSYDNATWQAFPAGGIPRVQYGCMVQALAELGPRTQVWIKLSVGAEDA